VGPVSKLQVFRSIAGPSNSSAQTNCQSWANILLGKIIRTRKNKTFTGNMHFNEDFMAYPPKLNNTKKSDYLFPGLLTIFE